VIEEVDAVPVVAVESAAAWWIFSFVVVMMVSSRGGSVRASLVGGDLLVVGLWVGVSPSRYESIRSSLAGEEVLDIKVAVSSPIGRGSSFPVAVVVWSPFKDVSEGFSLAGGDLLLESVWGAVSSWASVLLRFGKALRSSFVLPVISEEEESDEEQVSASSLF
jgi:hypothetical protein